MQTTTAPTIKQYTSATFHSYARVQSNAQRYKDDPEKLAKHAADGTLECMTVMQRSDADWEFEGEYDDEYFGYDAWFDDSELQVTDRQLTTWRNCVWIYKERGAEDSLECMYWAREDALGIVWDNYEAMKAQALAFANLELVHTR